MSEYICPRCGKPIYDDEALLCLYCGEDLERGVGVLGKMKYSKPWALVLPFLLIIIVVSFVLLMLQ